MKKNADQPYIFASGHDQKEIIQYYIIVEREIITVKIYGFCRELEETEQLLLFSLHFNLF